MGAVRPRLLKPQQDKRLAVAVPSELGPFQPPSTRQELPHPRGLALCRHRQGVLRPRPMDEREVSQPGVHPAEVVGCFVHVHGSDAMEDGAVPVTGVLEDDGHGVVRRRGLRAVCDLQLLDAILEQGAGVGPATSQGEIHCEPLELHGLGRKQVLFGEQVTPRPQGVHRELSFVIVSSSLLA